MSATDTFDWSGTTLDGRFAMEAVAGEGAFGIVYRGRHLALDVPVAVKCLKLPGTLEEPARSHLLAAFQAEARLLHRLSRQSAAIVQALDVGAQVSPSGAWCPYIVMEWLEGETLERELERRASAGLPRRSLAEAVRLLAPAAEALEAAHAEGVAHRDVKPANLFCTSTGAGPTLKLLDFGIAKVLTETREGSTALLQTGDGIRALTPQYAAPEQFNAHYGATGPWTDVFALGLVFIEICTGQRALKGSDLMQLYVASADEGARPGLSSLETPMDGAVEQVLRRAVAVQSSRRYRTAGELWRALGAAVADASAAAPSEPTLVLDRAGGGAEQAHPRAAPTLPEALGARARDARAAAARGGEHRICTVLFMDVVGLEDLSDELEPEELAAATERAIAIASEVVASEGGRVDRATGERIMAVFGVPRASEDDAERAVRASLRIRDGVAAIVLGARGRRRLRASARIGVHTGRVFARPAASAGEGVAVLGEAVHGASRLHHACPRGTILISRATHRASAGRFVVESVPDRALDAELQGVHRVDRLESGVAAGTMLEFCGLPTTFVGRAVEMARLRDLFETVRSEPRAAFCTVLGSPGIGKTRMVSEFSREVGGDPTVTRIVAHATPRSADSELGLVRSLVRSCVGVGAVTGAVDAALSELVALLGLEPDRAPMGFSPPPDSVAPDESGAAANRRLAAALASVFAAMTASGPLVVFCDDIHWAGDGSLDLLDDVVLRLGDRPVLFLATARPELLERRPHWGEGKATHDRLAVGPLARRHVEQMARDRLRLVDGPPGDLVRMLVDRAEGSALLLEATMHLLVDAGALVVGPTSWQLRQEALGALVLPPTIHGIIQARLDRLGPQTRRLLALASVIGRTFWQGALVELVASVDTGESDGLVERLGQLRERQLVRVRESSVITGEIELVFAESATHEVAYGSLGGRAKAGHHRTVAAWLEQRARGDATRALIASHHDQAGDVGPAAAGYARAGARAAALGQHDEALRYLGRAAEIHDATATQGDPAGDVERTSPLLEDNPDELRVATWRERCGLRLDLGDVLRRVGRLGEALARYEEARSLIIRTPGRAQDELEEGEEGRWEARVDVRLALAHKVRGDNAEARRLAERAIERATAADAVGETPAMWALLGAVLRRDGDLGACRAASLRGVLLLRRLRQTDPRSREALSSLMITLGSVYWSLGRLEPAARFYRLAARAVDEVTQPEPSSFALSNLGAVRFALGDWAGAQRSFQRSLALNERSGDLHTIAIAHSNMAEVSLRLGDVGVALRHAQESVRLGEQGGARADLPDMLRNLSEAFLATGDATSALEVVMRALALAQTDGGRVYLPAVARTCARVCRAASEPALGLATPADAAASALLRCLELTDGVVPGLGEECRELLGGAVPRVSTSAS